MSPIRQRGNKSKERSENIRICATWLDAGDSVSQAAYKGHLKEAVNRDV